MTVEQIEDENSVGMEYTKVTDSMTDEEMAEQYVKENGRVYYHPNGEPIFTREEDLKFAFLAGLKADRPQWHKLSEEYPEADKLVRVRLMSGMEHICETCYYEPTEDEIGYDHCITQFSELNGDWVDDNEVEYWCEIEPFKE